MSWLGHAFVLTSIFFYVMSTQGRSLLNFRKVETATRCPACFTINVPRSAGEEKNVDQGVKCALCGSHYSAAEPDAGAA